MSLSQNEAAVLLAARDRWSKDASLRRMHGCGHHRPGSPEFEAGLHRYATVCLKEFRDNSPGAPSPFQTRGDGIGRIVGNLASRE